MGQGRGMAMINLTGVNLSIILSWSLLLGALPRSFQDPTGLASMKMLGLHQRAWMIHSCTASICFFSSHQQSIRPCSFCDCCSPQRQLTKKAGTLFSEQDPEMQCVSPLVDQIDEFLYARGLQLQVLVRSRPCHSTPRAVIAREASPRRWAAFACEWNHLDVIFGAYNLGHLTINKVWGKLIRTFTCDRLIPSSGEIQNSSLLHSLQLMR